jgi:hypothetical protein
VTVFDEAPVENIFGSGISLHIDAGPDSLLAPGLPWGDLSQANEVPYAANANSSYTVAARNTHLSPERRPVFRYAIAGDSAPVGQTFSGQAEADGVNLILVPNSPCRGRSPCQVSSEKIARILMHELGHTLGLGHAGPRIVLGDFAKRNNEHPNYLSIMNYKFTGGLPKSTGEFVLDFSRFGPPLFDLDEQLLQESLGLGADASSVNNLETGYLCPNGSARRVTIGEPVDIDWNCNGIIDAQAVSVDLNRDGRIEVLPAVTDWDNLDYAYGGIGGLFDTPPEGEPDVEQTADEAIAAMRVFTGDHQPPIIRIEQGTGLREVVVTVEDDHQIDGILFDVDGEQRNVNGDGRKTITETVSFRGRLGIATSDVTGNRPDPVVIACEEDGVAGTGIVSGVVNDQVEPAVRGVDPAIAAVVDQMNCEVIDAVEEQIETAVGEGTVPATSVSDPGIAAATPAATRSRSLSSTGSVIGTNSSRPVAKPQLPIGFLPPVLEDLLRSADGPVARILAERSLVDVGGGE